MIPRQAVRRGNVVLRNGSRSLATATSPAKPRRSFTRILFVYVILPTSLVYGAGTYYAITSSNERFHSFWVERVPLTEPVVEYFEKQKVGQMVQGLIKKTESIPTSSTSPTLPVVAQKVLSPTDVEAAKKKKEEQEKKEKKLREEREAVKKAEVAAKEQAKKLAEEAAAAAAAVKETVTKVLPASSTLVGTSSKVEPIKDTISDVIHQAETAIKLPEGPRKDVDGHPLPPRKGPPKEPYNAPIPIGYEAPPGYAGFVPKRDVAPPDAKPTDIPKLPLIAPEIKGIAVSEPLVGQIAATIDSLTTFLNSNPVHSSSVVGVVQSARNDLKNLTDRMEKIKKEESEKLEQSLKEQALKYSDLLAKQEIKAIENIDTIQGDWQTAFDKEREIMLNSYKAKLAAELEVQKEIINDRLKEEVVQKGIELQRRWLREIKVKVEQERGGKLSKLKELQVGLKNLENLTLENSQALSQNMSAQKIWTSVRNAVVVALEAGVQQPFEKEIRQLGHLTAQNPILTTSHDAASPPDDLIAISIATIPPSVQTRGLVSFPDLVSRFTHSLTPAIRRAALFPNDGGLISYLTSVTLSPLLFKKEGWVEGEDVNARLARAEWHLLRRNLAGAVEELNGLQGWSKVLAHDWLNEARRHLEVKQALELAQTEAELGQLLVL